MILYFSGTGNSKYVAKRLSSILNDEIVSINEKIKNNDFIIKNDIDKLVFVTPTYAWRIPRVVNEWIQKTNLKNVNAWFVMTCGGEIGNAEKFNKQLCTKKNFTYMGTAQIVMPENYIAMFSTPTFDEAEKIIEKAEPLINKVGELLKSESSFPTPRNNLYDRIMSNAVNGLFYKLCVKANAFYAKDNCIGCGKCANNCPLNNIKLKDSKPIWGKDCTHCMACICYCPVEAIEYGKNSIGQPRYKCKK